MFYSLPAETNAYGNIVAAFSPGMHVSPAKLSYAWLPRKCDYQTDRHTDGQRTKWSLYAAMLRSRHNKWTTELDVLLNYENVSLNICNEYGLPTRTAQGTLTPPVTRSRLIWDLHASTTHSVTEYTSYFYDTSVIFSNFIIMYRGPFTGPT